jgi:hypothetical protein
VSDEAKRRRTALSLPAGVLMLLLSPLPGLVVYFELTTGSRVQEPSFLVEGALAVGWLVVGGILLIRRSTTAGAMLAPALFGLGVGAVGLIVSVPTLLFSHSRTMRIETLFSFLPTMLAGLSGVGICSSTSSGRTARASCTSLP